MNAIGLVLVALSVEALLIGFGSVDWAKRASHKGPVLRGFLFHARAASMALGIVGVLPTLWLVTIFVDGVLGYSAK